MSEKYYYYHGSHYETKTGIPADKTFYDDILKASKFKVVYVFESPYKNDDLFKKQGKYFKNREFIDIDYLLVLHVKKRMLVGKW